MPSFSPLRSQLFLRRFANNNFQSVRNIQQDEAEMEERWSGKDTRRSDRMRGGRRGGRGGGRGSDNRGGRGGGGGTSKWEGKQKRIEAARHTVQVLDSGVYVNKQGNEVDISTALSNAINGSILYERDHVWPSLGSAEPRETVIEVWAMTTLQACMKLVAAGDSGKIGCLNFASARHPGGGFLGGAQAQEESLARTSGLYACLTSAHCKKMYLINQQNKSCLYSHRIIYSPDVPVFKDDDGAILDEWYPMNFISSPAVNAGVVRQRDRNADGEIEATMKERIKRILSIAAEHQHDSLVLGAFGCGVFENRPADVAEWFAEYLFSPDSPFHNRFAKVVFAILDNKGGKIIEPFYQKFGTK